MGEVLISRKMVRKNKALNSIQKEDLKANKSIRTKFPKAKIGKIARCVSERLLDCTHGTEENKVFNVSQMSQKQILDVIKSQNLTGLSGSGFPTAEKIKNVIEAKADHKYFIINGAACDPGLLHDDWLLRNKEAEINKGIDIINSMVHFDKTIIASKNNLPRRYPMGAEKILIEYFLGRKLAKEQVPAQEGILVLNVQTVYAVYEAFYKQTMERSRYITIVNLETGEAEVAKVTLGSTVGDILKQTHIGYSEQSPVYAGMGMMDSETVKRSNCITAQTNMIAFGQKAEINDEAKCKGCGGCTKHCPMQVKVSKLVKAVRKGEREGLEELGISNCIACGTCTYFCAGGLNPMKLVQEASLKGRK